MLQIRLKVFQIVPECLKMSKDVSKCPRMSTSDASLFKWTCFCLPGFEPISCLLEKDIVRNELAWNRTELRWISFTEGCLDAEEGSTYKIHKNLFESGSSSKENGNAMLIEVRHNKIVKHAKKGQYTTMPIPKTSYGPKKTKATHRFLRTLRTESTPLYLDRSNFTCWKMGEKRK